MKTMFCKLLSFSAVFAGTLATFAANSTCLAVVYEPEAPAELKSLIKED